MPPPEIFLILGALRMLLMAFGHQKAHYYCDSNINKNTQFFYLHYCSSTHIAKEQFDINEIANFVVQVPKHHNANFRYQHYCSDNSLQSITGQMVGPSRKIHMECSSYGYGYMAIIKKSNWQSSLGGKLKCLRGKLPPRPPPSR